MTIAPAVQAGSAAVDAELALIGAIIQSGNMGNAGITEGDLGDERARILYRTLTDMDSRGIAIDPSTVRSELSSRKLLDGLGGERTLRHCAEACIDPSNAHEYANYVRLAASKRRITETVAKATDSGALLAGLERQATHLRNNTRRRDRGVTGSDMSDRIGGSFMGAARGVDFSYPSELDKLNRLTGGLRRGEYVLAAARTNEGKTIFSFQLMLHWLRSGSSVLYVNNEMMVSKLENVLLASMTGLPYRTVEDRDLDHQSVLMDATNELARYRFEVLEPKVWQPSEVAEIQSQERYDIVIYDHINRCGSEPAVLADVSRDLRNVALQYGCTVFCLQQLNPVNRDQSDWRPSMEDLRGSKTPGEEADQVLLLARKKAAYGRTILDDSIIRVAKSRTSGHGEVECVFDRRFLRFVEEST